MSQALGSLVVLLSIGAAVAGIISPKLTLWWHPYPGRIRAMIFASGLLFVLTGLAMFIAPDTSLKDTGSPFAGAVLGMLIIAATWIRLPGRRKWVSVVLPEPATVDNSQELDAARSKIVGLLLARGAGVPIVKPVPTLDGIEAIRAGLEQGPRREFDRLFAEGQRHWSLFGQNAVNRMNFDHACQTATLAKHIWVLKTGPLPSETVPISLQPGEQCTWSRSCDRYDYKAVRSASYGGAGVSVRVAKGVTVRTGGGRITPRSHEEFQKIDTGSLYLTTKRLVFIGARESLALRLGEIAAFKQNGCDIEIGRARGRNIHYRISGAEMEFKILLDRVAPS